MSLIINNSGGSRIFARWRCQLSKGCQYTILPNFPENWKKSKEFGPLLDPPMNNLIKKINNLNSGTPRKNELTLLDYFTNYDSLSNAGYRRWITLRPRFKHLCEQNRDVKTFLYQFCQSREYGSFRGWIRHEYSLLVEHVEEDPLGMIVQPTREDGVSHIMIKQLCCQRSPFTLRNSEQKSKLFS